MRRKNSNPKKIPYIVFGMDFVTLDFSYMYICVKSKIWK